MKKVGKLQVGMFMVLSLISSQAFAECFSFYNGVGPTRIAATLLPSLVDKMCIEGNSVTLYDSNGSALLIAGASISRAREINGEIDLDLSYGNANGRNVNFTGTRVVIQNGSPNEGIGMTRRMTITGADEVFYVVYTSKLN